MQKHYMVLSSSRRKILHRNSHDKQECNNHGLSKVEGKSVLFGELFLQSQVLQDGRGKGPAGRNRGKGAEGGVLGWLGAEDVTWTVTERPSPGSPSSKQGHQPAAMPPPLRSFALREP